MKSLTTMVLGAMALSLGLSQPHASPAAWYDSAIRSDSAGRAMYILPLASNDFLVVGYVTDEDAGDIVLHRLDSNLSFHWTKHLRKPGLNFAFSALRTSDNHIVLAGFTNFQTAGSLDAYLVKLDNQGQVIWERTLGGAQDDRLIRIIETKDHNYVAIGQTSSQGAGSIDGWLVKLSAQGDTLWTKTLGGALLDRTYSVEEIPGGDLIIAGITKANYPEDSDILLMRVTSAGQELWTRQVGSDRGDIAHSLLKLPDGTFVTVGYTAERSFPSCDPLLIHFNVNGEILGKHIHLGQQEMRLMDAYMASPSMLVAAGYVRDHAEDDWDGLLLTFDFVSGRFTTQSVAISEGDDEFFHLVGQDGATSILVGHTANQSTTRMLIQRQRHP